MVAVLLTTQAIDFGGFSAAPSVGATQLPAVDSDAGFGVQAALPFGRDLPVRPAVFVGADVERLGVQAQDAAVVLTAPTFVAEAGLRARWGPGPLRGVAEAGWGGAAMLAVEDEAVRSSALALSTHGLVGAEITTERLPPLLLALRVSGALSPGEAGWVSAAVTEGDAVISWSWNPVDVQAALCAGVSFGGAR